jgi:hypothetical protein
VSTATASLEIVAESEVVGRKLYGAESNPYYAAPQRRVVTVRITRNVEGIYRVTAVLPNHNTEYASALFTSEAEAREDANRVYLFVRDVFHGQMRDDEGSRIAGSEGHSLCPTCGRYDTLKTEQQAWGAATTCGRGECSYDHFYSIGD